MRHHIPEHWKAVVRQHILQTRGVEYDQLSAYDFPSNQSVRVLWPDGSSALFRFAFFLRHPEQSEIAIFTEHCGYYFLRGDDEDLKVTKEVSTYE